MKIVAFDLETTGFNPDKDKIIEIGAVKYEKQRLIGKFKEFIRIKEELPYRITELTGISDLMLEKEGKPLIEVLLDFRDFIKDVDVLIAHNSKFDVKFLNWNFQKQNIETQSKKVFCTMEIERELDKVKHGKAKKNGYKLANLTEKYNIQYENGHRAYNDAEMTMKVLYAQGKECKKIGYKAEKNHSNIDRIVISS